MRSKKNFTRDNENVRHKLSSMNYLTALRNSSSNSRHDYEESGKRKLTRQEEVMMKKYYPKK